MSFTFGATAPASGGFSFGSTAPAAAAPATGGFSFGSTAPAAAPAAAPATGGFSFGSTTTAAAPAAAPATGGFSFGSTTTAAAPASTGFSFGSTTTAAPAATTGGFSFGNTAAPAAAPAVVAPTQQIVQPLPTGAYLPLGGYVRDVQDPVVKKINEISDAVNPASPKCLFQYVLYNLLPPNSPYKDRLTKPPHANDDIWQRGVAENPDPERFAPCLVVGWSDLLIRLQEQHKALTAHISTMEHLASKTNDLVAVQHALHQDIQKAKEKQHLLNARALNIVSRISRLILSDTPLTEGELEYKQRLERLNARLSTPGEYLDKIGTLNDLINIQTSLANKQQQQQQQQEEQEDEEDNENSDGSDSDDDFDMYGYDDSEEELDEDYYNNGDDDEDDAARQKRIRLEKRARRNAKRGLLPSTTTTDGTSTIQKTTTPYGTITTISRAEPVQLSTLLAVVAEQSKMIQDLVDEVSLCVVDVQACQTAIDSPQFA